MDFRPRILIVVATLLIAKALSAQETSATKPSPRETLRASAWEFGDPGGMLFHTAFHQGYTTRYLLLKGAIHIEELSAHLSLDVPQRVRIEILRPVEVDLKNPLGVTDPNAQPDEQILDPEYFDFLRPDQLLKLDVIALRFDGYCALTRSSLAERLMLSKQSRAKIAREITAIRNDEFLPRFRWEFAAPLPDDIKYRDSHFAGSLGTQLNRNIIEVLSDEECRCLTETMAAAACDPDVLTALEKLAPLPGGIGELLRFHEMTADHGE